MMSQWQEEGERQIQVFAIKHLQSVEYKHFTMQLFVSSNNNKSLYGQPYVEAAV